MKKFIVVSIISIFLMFCVAPSKEYTSEEIKDEIMSILEENRSEFKLIIVEGRNGWYNLEKNVLVTPNLKYIMTHELGHTLSDMLHKDNLKGIASNDLRFKIAVDKYKTSKKGLDKEEIEKVRNIYLDRFGIDNLKDMKGAQAQDIISALTYGHGNLNWKHNTDYWLLDDSRIYEEIFANLVGMYLSESEEDIEWMRESFPEIVDAFERIIF